MLEIVTSKALNTYGIKAGSTILLDYNIEDDNEYSELFRDMYNNNIRLIIENESVFIKNWTIDLFDLIDIERLERNE